MTVYNVFRWCPHKGYDHVLEDVDKGGLRYYLTEYVGKIDNLTIIEGKSVDNDQVLKSLGLTLPDEGVITK